MNSAITKSMRIIPMRSAGKKCCILYSLFLVGCTSLFLVSILVSILVSLVHVRSIEEEKKYVKLYFKNSRIYFEDSKNM